MLRRPLSAVALAAMLAFGAAACVTSKEDTELNPQPLPPSEPGDSVGAPSSPEAPGSDTPGDGSNDPGADAGADDASADGGDEDSGDSSTDGEPP